jgi:hypothetical protein
MEHLTEEVTDHRLWLSVSNANGKILISSNDTSSFSWSEAGPSTEQYKKFKKYLDLRVKNLVIDTVRTGQIQSETLTAALAVDQSLTYQHVRPVIYALAEAGISRYGFETRIIR